MSEENTIHPLTFEEYNALPKGTELWMLESGGYQVFSLFLVKKKEEQGKASPNTIPQYDFADSKRNSAWYVRKFDEKDRKMRFVGYEEYCVGKPLFNASPLEIISWWSQNIRR